VSPFSPQVDLACKIGAIYPLQKWYQKIRSFVKRSTVDNQKPVFQLIEEKLK